ncbi:MAG TPA: hypothetical protein EYH56_01805 [Nanoarchaeota archaeon]|nr:hypothetical protein [Nanoarchaeota archaeon]
MKLEFVATCTPGLEKISIRELKEKFGIKAQILHKGALIFKGSEKHIYELNYLAKTLHRIVILLGKAKVESLEEIYNITKEIEYSQFILPEQTFAVKAKRSGKHEFTSIDIASVVGQAIIDSYMNSKKKRLKVNLSYPDIRFLCELCEKSFWFGLDTTGESLHKRWYRKYSFITSLRSTIAYSMAMLCELKQNKSFHDPMCGTGMIPIEAFHFLSQKPNKYRSFAFEKFYWLNLENFEKLKNSYKENKVEALILASDKNSKVVKLAKQNALFGEAQQIKFFVADATKIKLCSQIICTDLPYGIRLRKVNLKKLYNMFFENLKANSNFEKLVFITAKRCLKFLPKPFPFELKEFYDLNYGEIKARIFVCKN